ncbi:MAG: hypothetical protein A3F46_03995 [Legionellales bacterium RIFCSPHIGHO2_12_FULL_42_9]|nr:MAG: hypothetical protein A3F46_03995 [Legionellales bacterium RIFCSPHIGHO2_12_FULL_42_9]
MNHSHLFNADQQLQQRMLPGVSRTFALTIPQLNEPLATVVTNAYLLCRVADTIEDDNLLSQADKAAWHQQLYLVLLNELDAEEFSAALESQLSPITPVSEKELINNLPAVIRCFRCFNSIQQQSLLRCITIMLQGMPKFQRNISVAGLLDMQSLENYCYCVAGVVGEMLTELFCHYSAAIAVNQERLMELAPCFGQGLQMTNILQDFWIDRQRGVCWLPQDIFRQHGVDLASLNMDDHREVMRHIFRGLIKYTIAHLQKALEYSMLIPASERGIRRFTLWSLGLAVLTLRNLDKQNNRNQETKTKINRKTVKLAILVLNTSCHNNLLLKYLFNLFTRKLR